MKDKEWIELEIDYIKTRLDEVARTSDKSSYKNDNVRRLKEIKIKIDSLLMVMS